MANNKLTQVATFCTGGETSAGMANTTVEGKINQWCKQHREIVVVRHITVGDPFQVVVHGRGGDYTEWRVSANILYDNVDDNV